MNWFQRKWDTFLRLSCPRRRRERRLLDPEGAYEAALADAAWAKAVDEIMARTAPALSGTAGEAEFHYPSDTRFTENGYYKYMLGRYMMAARLIGGKKAVDCCAGLGWGGYLLAHGCESVTAFDIDPRAVEWAAGAWKRGNLNFLVADALEPPFAPGSFGAACAFESIEHLDVGELAPFVKAVAGLLAPGGVFLGSTAFVATERDARAVLKAGPAVHRTILTVARARELFRPYFREFEIVDRRIFKARKR